jgi:Holliday junction DNA helicase RuvA
MIVSIRGKLREKHATSAWIDVGGVGYGLQISLSTYEALPKAGAEVELFTLLVVREDAHQLFGFATTDERKLFEMLLTVSGVGPRVAIGVLSGMRPEALRRAIRASDVGALTMISGVGKKTAERIVVDLRDKFAAEAPVTAGAEPLSSAAEDAIAALVSLGFPQPQARKAVQVAVEDAGREAPVEEIVRRSLAVAGKS